MGKEDLVDDEFLAFRLNVVTNVIGMFARNEDTGIGDRSTPPKANDSPVSLSRTCRGLSQRFARRIGLEDVQLVILCLGEGACVYSL